MSIKFNARKLLGFILKLVVGLGFLAGLAWGGYELYMSWSNTPFNVRVTNITARSASVTWLTERPSAGTVVYSDSKDMGLLNYQALVAYDDRDTENALSEIIDGIDTSGGEVEFPNISDIEVKKQGKYYVHHITVTNLEPEEEYFFKVRNGIRGWNESMVGYSNEHNSVGVIDNFIIETAQALDSVPSPSPAYGQILSIQEGSNGELEDKETDDGLIFYRLENLDEEYESEFLSAVTNSKGGWSVDRSNARSNGELMEFEVGKDLAIIFANVENSPEDYQLLLITGEDEPAPVILGSTDEEEEYSIVKPSVTESLIDTVEDDVYADNCDGGCHNGWIFGDMKQKCGKNEKECDPDARKCGKKSRCPKKPATGDTSSNGSSGTTTAAGSAGEGEWGAEAGCTSGALGYNRKCGSDTCSGETAICFRDCKGAKKVETCVGEDERVTGPADSSEAPSDTSTSSKTNKTATTGLCCVDGVSIPNRSESTCLHVGGSVGRCNDGSTVTVKILDCCIAGRDSKAVDSATCRSRGGIIGICERTATVEDSEKDKTSNPEVFTCPPYSQSPGAEVGNLRDCCLDGYECSRAGDWRLNCSPGYYKYPPYGKRDAKCVQWFFPPDTGDDIEVIAEEAWNGCCYDTQDSIGTFYRGEADGLDEVDCNSGVVKGYLTSENDRALVDVFECSSSSSSSSSVVYASAKAVLGVSTATATVSDGSTVVFPESGIYEVNIGGEIFNVLAREGDENTFYKDSNEIPGYQEGEDTVIELTGITLDVEKKVGTNEISFKEGINLISFPYLPIDVEENSLTAIAFLNIANLHGQNISRISFFEAGKWQSGISVDIGSEDWSKGRDFDLLPGRGYVVVANQDFRVDVPAKDLNAGVPVALSAGWNLTGINGFTESFTARTLITSINDVSGLTSDNVTWWPTSKGRYEGFQVSEGTEYGFDYPISNELGYFIRITDFSPENSLTKSVLWGPGTDLHGQPGSN